MEVIYMARVFDGSMAATLAMLVTVIAMRYGGAHKL